MVKYNHYFETNWVIFINLSIVLAGIDQIVITWDSVTLQFSMKAVWSVLEKYRVWNNLVLLKVAIMC